jgi:hypothetical protein
VKTIPQANAASMGGTASKFKSQGPSGRSASRSRGVVPCAG